MASVFSGKIVCGRCGSHFCKGVVNSNKTDGRQENWICYGKNSRGKRFCDAKNITGDRLREAAAQALDTPAFDEMELVSRVEKIIVPRDGELEFHFYDGTISTVIIETYQPNQQSISDPHKPFPGYVWTKEGYTIVPEEAEMVRMVFRLYLEGNSLARICQEVAAAGYTSFRGKVSTKFISRMLDDERYTGRRILPARYSGTGREEVRADDHEAIIPQELFDKVKNRRIALREKYGSAHTGEKKGSTNGAEEKEN